MSKRTADLLLVTMAAKNVASHLISLNYKAAAFRMQTSTLPTAISEYTAFFKETLNAKEKIKVEEIEEDYASEYALTAQSLFYESGDLNAKHIGTQNTIKDNKMNQDTNNRSVDSGSKSIQEQFDAIQKATSNEKASLHTNTSNNTHLDKNQTNPVYPENIFFQPTTQFTQPIDSIPIKPIDQVKHKESNIPAESIKEILKEIPMAIPIPPKKVLVPSKVPTTRAGRLFQYGSKSANQTFIIKRSCAWIRIRCNVRSNKTRHRQKRNM